MTQILVTDDSNENQNFELGAQNRPPLPVRAVPVAELSGALEQFFFGQNGIGDGLSLNPWNAIDAGDTLDFNLSIPMVTPFNGFEVVRMRVLCDSGVALQTTWTLVVNGVDTAIVGTLNPTETGVSVPGGGLILGDGDMVSVRSNVAAPDTPIVWVVLEVMRVP